MFIALAAFAVAQEQKEIVPDNAERDAQQDISHRLAKLKEDMAQKENALALEAEIVRLRMCLRAGVKLEQCGDWTPQGNVQILPLAPNTPDKKN